MFVINFLQHQKDRNKAEGSVLHTVCLFVFLSLFPYVYIRCDTRRKPPE